MDRISTPSTAPSFLRFLPCFMDEPVTRTGSVQPSRAQNRFPTFQRVTTSTVSRWRSLTTDWGKHDGKGRREDRKNTTKTVTQHGSHREAEAFKIKRLSCKIVTPLFGTKRSKGLQFAAIPFFLPAAGLLVLEIQGIDQEGCTVPTLKTCRIGYRDRCGPSLPLKTLLGRNGQLVSRP